MGGTGADVLTGDAGADRLEGGPHGDRLIGLAGGDRIIGGTGRDRVSGGAGADVVSVADRSRDRVALRGRPGSSDARPAGLVDGVRDAFAGADVAGCFVHVDLTVSGQ